MSYDDKMKAVTDNIRKQREKRGLSQGKMAELLGVSRPFYCQVETGKRTISMRRLIQISEIFNVTLDVLTKPRTIVVKTPTPTPERTAETIIAEMLDRGRKENQEKDQDEEQDTDVHPNDEHPDDPDLEPEKSRPKGYSEAPPRRHHSSVRRTQHSSWTYHPGVA